MSGSGQSNGRAASAGRDLVVLTASEGGVTSVGTVLAALPADFPAPVVVVQHGKRTDLLVPILQRRSRLPVLAAEHGAAPAAGTVFVADSSRQLLIGSDRRFEVAPDADARCRADPLLESAAAAFRAGVVAAVLTGRLDDGASGATAVKAAGGRVLAQDRATSRAFGMPAAAIATGCVDFILPLDAIATVLVTFTMAPAAAELFRVARPPWALPAA